MNDSITATAYAWGVLGFALGFGAATLADIGLEFRETNQRQAKYHTCIQENTGGMITDSEVYTVDRFCRILTGYKGE